MSQRDLPAQHYLSIYRIKQGMARASPDGMRFINQLVDALASLEPDTPVRLDASADRVQFRNAVTGALLGELRLGDV
jgi:hypothetical protein